DTFLCLGADRRLSCDQRRRGSALAHAGADAARGSGGADLGLEFGARRSDPGQSLVARLIDLGDVELGFGATVAAQLYRAFLAEAEGELADEEGQHRDEEEQPERADVADAAAGEVLQGEVAGPRQQRPEGPWGARVPVEHTVEHVAHQAREM